MLCLKLESSMVLHSLMHSGSSSKKAKKKEGEGRKKKRRRHKWIERDVKNRGHCVSQASFACSTVMKITVLQPEASVLFQPLESGQVSCSCSICWWRCSGEELGPQKDGRSPEASSSSETALSKAV